MYFRVQRQLRRVTTTAATVLGWTAEIIPSTPAASASSPSSTPCATRKAMSIARNAFSSACFLRRRTSTTTGFFFRSKVQTAGSSKK
ncbi:hypothetical protein ACFXTH_039893 [Malus domestica]